MKISLKPAWDLQTITIIYPPQPRLSLQQSHPDQQLPRQTVAPLYVQEQTLPTEENQTRPTMNGVTGEGDNANRQKINKMYVFK